MLDKLAFYLSMEDPESTGTVEDAYCVLVETHTNLETETLVAVFKCWRTKEAYLADKRAFSGLNVTFSKDEGGERFFHQCESYKSGSFFEDVRNFCVEQHDLLRGALKANQHLSKVEATDEPA